MDAFESQTVDEAVDEDQERRAIERTLDEAAGRLYGAYGELANGGDPKLELEAMAYHSGAAIAALRKKLANAEAEIRGLQLLTTRLLDRLDAATANAVPAFTELHAIQIVPEFRVRLNHASTVKEGWRTGETTVECTFPGDASDDEIVARLEAIGARLFDVGERTSADRNLAWRKPGVIEIASVAS